MEEVYAKLAKLAVVILDNLIVWVPVVMTGGLWPFVMAWLKKRRKAMTNDIEDWAVEAEQVIGRKKGPEKHAHVKKLAKETYPMARQSTLDAIISGPGTEAANVYRASLRPADPEANEK